MSGKVKRMVIQVIKHQIWRFGFEVMKDLPDTRLADFRETQIDGRFYNQCIVKDDEVYDYIVE